MVDLRANAIITAVDRFSGPVSRMSGALKGLTGTAAGVVSGTKRAGRAINALGSGMGVPTALAGAFALQGEYVVDRLSRQMQAVGELNADQRKLLVEEAFKTSVAVGKGADEILGAQGELIRGGMDASTAAALGTPVAQAAKTHGMALDAVAEDAINVARSLGFAFDTVQERTTSLTRALEFMSVVPNISTETWEGLRESLKHAAPVAAALKMPVTELGAALSILADVGFKGEEGGTALRTMFLRMLGPTKAATQAMRAAGIQLEELYEFDPSRINDTHRLSERLAAAGFDVENLDLDRFKNVDAFDGLYKYQDELQKHLMESLNVDSGDAQSRGVLKAAIDQHVFSGMNRMNVQKYFSELGKLPISEFKKLFGIQRTPQAIKLQQDLHRFSPLLAAIEERMPGSIKRLFGVIDDGFAQSIDRLGERFAFMRHRVFEAGLGSDLEQWFDGIASTVEQLAKTNPQALSAITKGGLIALLASGIGALASSPWGRAAMAVTGLAVAANNYDHRKGILRQAFGDEQPGAGGRKPDGQSWGFSWELFKKQLAELPLLWHDALYGTDNSSGRRDVLRLPGEREPLDFGQGRFGSDMIRSLPAAVPIDVTGKVDANVQGTVSGRMEVEVKVIGPGIVTQKSGGELRGSLNTGKSMPDAGK